MNSTQKRTVLALAAITVLVFVAVVIASTGDPGDESTAAGVTPTPPTVSPSSTAGPTTTTSPTSTTIPTSTIPTSTSSTTTSTSTTTTTTAPPTLVLREDGLGVVAFGSEAEIAVASIIAALGAPDEDSGWVPSFSRFGTCPGEQVRGLRWATMWALMTDGDTEWRNDGVPHFFSYLNSVFFEDGQSLGLLTEEGIGLGDTVADLDAAYRDRLEVSFEELFNGYVFSIEVPEPGRLWGGLTGDDGDDRITSIDGGVGCGE